MTRQKFLTHLKLLGLSSLILFWNQISPPQSEDPPALQVDPEDLKFPQRITLMVNTPVEISEGFEPGSICGSGPDVLSDTGIVKLWIQDVETGELRLIYDRTKPENDGTQKE